MQIRGIGREELVAAVDAIGLAGVNPAGTVVFRRNGRVIGRVRLVGGTASLVLPRRIPRARPVRRDVPGQCRGSAASTSALLVLPAERIPDGEELPDPENPSMPGRVHRYN